MGWTEPETSLDAAVRACLEAKDQVEALACEGLAACDVALLSLEPGAADAADVLRAFRRRLVALIGDDPWEVTRRMREPVARPGAVVGDTLEDLL